MDSEPFKHWRLHSCIKRIPPPPRVIRRILAATIVIAAMSLGLTTIPAQADTTNLPDHIVNGDFEYPHILPQTPDTTYKKAWAGSPLEAWAMEWASSWTDITPYDIDFSPRLKPGDSKP